jgi:hypothetical protein
MNRIITSIFAFISLAYTASAAEIVVTDNGSGTGTTTWTSDNIYILDGFVFVNSGQTLTIEAGTVIKGMSGTGSDASALIVARGGRILAEGTAQAPIVFTYENDPLDGSTPYSTQGQWGGLIVLGNAGLNSIPGETQIEGIPETETRGLYGGDDDSDDSGIIRYISIRHGGTDIGAGNEINGFTLGGVGSETIIEYVEVISNADDGIEFFGGTVDVKHAVVAFVGDDSFDYDEGWRGKGQFWVAIQEPGVNGDRGGEHDGGTSPEDGTPYATPVIYNSTFVGKGLDGGSRALTIRDNAGGQYHNSIFYGWGKGIDVENLPSGEDSYERLLDLECGFAGNCFYNVGVNGVGTASDIFKITMGAGWPSPADSTAALTLSSGVFQATFSALGNISQDPGFTYSIAQGSEGLAIVPTNDLGSGIAPVDPFYTNASYRGAFDPSDPCNMWTNNWTLIDQYGFLESCVNTNEVAVNTSKVSVFPNPNAGTFSIQLPEGFENGTINIYSLSGSLVASKAINTMSNRFDFKLDVNAGLYLVSVVSSENTWTSRMIVE